MDEEKDEKDEKVYTYVKQCADCGSKKVLVKDSRTQVNGAIRRTRECSDCGFIFFTVEIEECVSDLSGLLQDNEKLKKENEALKERIRLIKARVQDM